METKYTKDKWHTSTSEVKKNEHSKLFMSIYSTTVANSIVGVAYSKENKEIEVKANALLISKAPELLNALIDIVEKIDFEKYPKEYKTINKLIKESTKL